MNTASKQILQQIKKISTIEKRKGRAGWWELGILGELVQVANLNKGKPH